MTVLYLFTLVLYQSKYQLLWIDTNLDKHQSFSMVSIDFILLGYIGEWSYLEIYPVYTSSLIQVRIRTGIQLILIKGIVH